MPRFKKTEKSNRVLPPPLLTFDNQELLEREGEQNIVNKYQMAINTLKNKEIIPTPAIASLIISNNDKHEDMSAKQTFSRLKISLDKSNPPTEEEAISEIAKYISESCCFSVTIEENTIVNKQNLQSVIESIKK